MSTSFLAQVTQPTPDSGPFGDVGDKVLGVLAWATPTVSMALLLVTGAWLAYAYLDSSQDETKPKKVVLWVVIGGAIASFAANIVNWSFGGS